MAPFKPLRKKRALLVSVRHVRPGSKVGARFSGFPDLRFAHRDAKAFREHLIANRGYHEDDVILMMDAKGHPESLWPTRNKILRQMDCLTRDVPEDSHICFYFSGHGLEEEGDGHASMRADGRDGQIICADGKPILDRTLHDRLVMRLKRVKGSKLFALLDCCHSESLLNPRKVDGAIIYSRVWRVGPGQLFIDLVIVIVNLLKLCKRCRKKYRKFPPPPRRASSGWREPPASKTKEVGELSLICVSACRDGQEAHDDCERELTFTKCFLDVVKTKPNLTWTELRDSLKELVSEIQARYEEKWRQGLVDESDEPWTQEPRLCTNFRADLTRSVSL